MAHSHSERAQGSLGVDRPVLQHASYFARWGAPGPRQWMSQPSVVERTTVMELTSRSLDEAVSLFLDNACPIIMCAADRIMSVPNTRRCAC